MTQSVLSRNRPSSYRLKDRRPSETEYRLFFPIEVRPLLSRFRVHVLQTIYECAQKELGDKLISATVSVYYDHYEPVPPILILGIAADIDGEEFGRVHRALVESIGLEALLWSDAEKSDYRAAIHFELVPLDI